MENDVTHDLDQRLRAARPAAARVDENAFGADLLSRLRDQPIAHRRRVPRAVSVPVAAGVTLTATAVVMLGGGPGQVGGPSSAAAITQALHWLSPPAGMILHVRSVETQGGRITTREFWQSADDPKAARLRVGGTESYETAGENRYDPASDTIHLGGAAEAIGKPGGGRAMPTGDPIRREGQVPAPGPSPRGHRPHRPQRDRSVGDRAAARRRPARVEALGGDRRRQAAGAARPRSRRERGTAGHPLADL
jgi:hypothetical protein